jgi:hypothetical protein
MPLETPAPAGTPLLSNPAPRAVEIGTGGSGGVGTRRTRGRVAGSTQNLQYGRADVKVYPINEDQLVQLGTFRGLASVCLTLAGAAFGFGLNVYKDLQIQGQVPTDVLAYWGAVRDLSFCASIALLIVAIILFGFGHHRLAQIKGNTKFDA